MNLLIPAIVGILALTAPAGSTADDPPDVTAEELAATIEGIAFAVENIVLPEAQDAISERTDQGQRVIDLTADVLFEFDSAVVVPAGAERIAELARELPQGSRLVIGGHTDSIGDDAYNLNLSQQRAEAVAVIIRAARPDLVLTVAGYGESQPVAPNTNGADDNPEGRAQNRRVELRVG